MNSNSLQLLNELIY